MSNTYGEFFISVACGDVPSQVMSEYDSKRAHQELCEEIAPSIEALREEQRWTTEDELSLLTY